MRPFNLLSRLRFFTLGLDNRRQRLFRVAYSWCQDPALADDLVQETMYKAWRSISDLREHRLLDAWLFNILVNCWRDHLRRRRSVEDIDDEAIMSELVVENEQERFEMIERVRKAIFELPIAQREVIALVDLEGFSYKDVARLLDIPQGTVTSRVTRARETLRRRLRNTQSQGDSARIIPMRGIK